MKLKFPSAAAIALLTLSLPVAADVIYSNSLNTTIPLDFTGVTINVDSGSINPFFGGVGVANNVALQPFRDGTGGSDTILNFTAGDIINGSTNTLASPGGFGGSIDHVGGTFTAGSEGNVGFKLSGANYGWMRVVFTNNTSGAVVKDWAYDDSGAAIAVGNITTNGSVVTADSTYGDFTVGSVLTDVGGAISFVKSGTGTVNLKATNTYTGTTTVSGGRLNVNGSTNVASTVTVNATKTLGGDGVINGNVTLNGILRAGQGGVTDRTLTIAGVLTANTGSSMVFNVAGEGDHDQLYVGSVDLTNTNLSIESFTDSTVTELGAGGGANFLTSGASFYELINGTTTNMFANVTETMSAGELAYYGLSGTQYRYTEAGQIFWVTQGLSSTYLVAIPEPSITLLGSLSLLGLVLRRRR